MICCYAIYVDLGLIWVFLLSALAGLAAIISMLLFLGNWLRTSGVFALAWCGLMVWPSVFLTLLVLYSTISHYSY